MTDKEEPRVVYVEREKQRMPWYRIAAYILVTVLCVFLFWFAVIYQGGV